MRDFPYKTPLILLVFNHLFFRWFCFCKESLKKTFPQKVSGASPACKSYNELVLEQRLSAQNRIVKHSERKEDVWKALRLQKKGKG